MEFAAIIPARYASTRFPAKPLAVLGGKPVIIRVCEQASKVFDHVFVATDDERIFNVVKDGGFTPVMTRSDHKSGTDRCYEAFCKCGVKADVVVNIQGDEPFIQPSQLQTVKSLFDSPETDIATLVKPFTPDTPFDKVANPNSPKVVVDDNWNALYFSRSVIPYLRGIPSRSGPHVILITNISDFTHSRQMSSRLLRNSRRLRLRRPRVLNSCAGFLPAIASR